MTLLENWPVKGKAYRLWRQTRRPWQAQGSFAGSFAFISLAAVLDPYMAHSDCSQKTRF